MLSVGVEERFDRRAWDKMDAPLVNGFASY